MPSALESRIAALEGDDGTLVILRGCRHCGTEVEGDPGAHPCGQHPPAPPAGKTITIERSYGNPPRLH